MNRQEQAREDRQHQFIPGETLQLLPVTEPGDRRQHEGCKAQAKSGDDQGGRLFLGKTDKERPGFKVPYVTGPEYQVIDDIGFPAKLEQWQKAGCDYAMYTCDTTLKKLAPVGEWNRSKIVFDNGHAEYWLNDQKLLEFEAWTDDWFTRKESGKWDFAPEYGL